MTIDEGCVILQEMIKVEKLKAAIAGRTLKPVGTYQGPFTCPCGGRGQSGVVLEDVDNGDRLILGIRCAQRYVDPSILRGGKKGRRVKFSQEFVNSFHSKDEVKDETRL